MTIAIAHRGDPVGYIENTLEAFHSAQALGAQMIELDCKLTRDGHVVVLHDHTTKRIWGVPRAISELSLTEVTALHSRGCRVPQLAEVLADIHLPVMVDVPGTAVMRASIEVVLRARALDRCIFAGELGALALLRRLQPTARVALSWESRRLPGNDLLDAIKPQWYNPYFRRVTPQVVSKMHERGLFVSVWTVDKDPDISRVLGTGVDGVISNQVERLVQAVRLRSGAQPPGAIARDGRSTRPSG